MARENKPATPVAAIGVRGVAFLTDLNGNQYERPIQQTEVILDLERDLLTHLSETPCSDELLRQLRNYCDARLAAREQARAAGAIAILGPNSTWHVI